MVALETMERGTPNASMKPYLRQELVSVKAAGVRKTERGVAAVGFD